MDDKRFTYFFIGFMVVVFLSGATYLVLYFSSGKKENKVEAFESFATKKGVYSNKKKAYDDLAKDSILNARNENVRVNLSSVFGKKVQTEEQKKGDLIAKEEQTNPEAIHPKPRLELQKNAEHLPGKKSVPHLRETGQMGISSVNAATPETKSQTSPPKPRTRDGFSSTFSNSPQPGTGTSVNAVVHSRQEVYEGATVKLRLTSGCTFQGVNIAKNTFIYGIVSLNNERVQISIVSIPQGENIIPVHLSAFDKDGIEGVYIPGLTMHEAKKESVDAAISEATTRLNVPVVGSVPLHVARNRNNVITAILTDGYRVILK